MNDVQASFIPDEQKLAYKLTADDMFDRIINLKLNCYDETTYEKESFVIRSDYEMIYPDSSMPIDGTIIPSMSSRCMVRRCSMKPSIKVNCKMVSSNTGLSVEIYISNFFLLTKDGKHLRSFNSAKYKIDSVEIAMGYWGQFSSKEIEARLSNPSAFYDEFFTIRAGSGADKITIVSPIVVTTEKLPPDSVLCIKGYVADIMNSPVAVGKLKVAEDVEKAIGNPVASSGDGLEQIMYKCITRRYLNTHYFTDGAGQDEKTGNIFKEVSDITLYPVSVEYDKDTAYLTDTDAKEYGVRVFLTDKVKQLKIPEKESSDGSKVKQMFYAESGWTIGHTIARLSSFFQADLEYTFNSAGDVLLYLTEEVTDPKSIYSSFVKDKVYANTVFSKIYNNKLPAVYNVNIDTVATIVCPFFTFIEPFQYLEFASRYALTSITGYFANYKATIYKFYAINAQISFATVEDVNEVHITAVPSTDVSI